MAKVTIDFNGGFAWLFDGDGTGAQATVGLVKAKAGSKYQHEWEIVVDQIAITAATTAHSEPDPEQPGKQVFRASGVVTLGIDGTAPPPGPLTRNVSTTNPRSHDDFYYVFNVARLKGVAQAKADPNALSVRMDVPAGTLIVSGEARFEWKFKDAKGSPHGNDRHLASKIRLEPTKVPTKTAELSWGGVTVVCDASKPLTITMRAACACGSKPLAPDDPAPGFFEVYELYPSGVPDDDRLIPFFKGAAVLTPPERGQTAGSGSDAIRTPGPDCPLTEHRK